MNGLPSATEAARLAMPAITLFAADDGPAVLAYLRGLTGDELLAVAAFCVSGVATNLEHVAEETGQTLAQVVQGFALANETYESDL